MIDAAAEDFALAEAFAIARGSKTHARVVVATVTRDGVQGRGEAVPYGRYGETVEGVIAQIASLPRDIDRAQLQHALPPGAARNAVDCALWDHAAKAAGQRVWTLAGLPAPRPAVTAFTLSLAEPDAMRATAARHAHRPVLKVKLGTPDDLPRLEAVRAGAPRPALLVDANEGWTEPDYFALLPHLVRLGVRLVEQPLPAGADAALARLPRPVPVCADESCHTRADLPALVGRYDAVNVKLDKAGGLTEALSLAAEARAQGFGLMVGCMVATSLAMAPALLVAQGADWVDLDGPLLLRDDRPHALRYDAAGAHPPLSELWG
jgi:L-alanine-DL-glutamate epimerase-like enolase superfamily enzyme